MVTAFELTGNIAIDIANAIKGLQKVAEEGREAEAKLKKTSQKMQDSFGKVGDGAWNVAGKVAKAGTVIAGILGGLVLKGGFDRAMQIENAQAKLKGLGNSAEDIKTVMDNALASVKGTAFGLGDAASVAASSMASGIKPGESLERHIKLIADAATIGGATMGEMGLIFNSVAGRGRLLGDDLKQLNSRGIGLAKGLAKGLNISLEEARDRLDGGAISFEDFQIAMEHTLSGAALASGSTFTGAMNNTRAALSRLGETAAKPIMDVLRKGMGDVIPIIDDLAKKAQPFFEELIPKAASFIRERLIPGLAILGENALPIVTGLFKTLGDVIGFVLDHMNIMGPIIITVAAALLAIKPAIAIVKAYEKAAGLAGNMVKFWAGEEGKAGATQKISTAIKATATKITNGLRTANQRLGIQQKLTAIATAIQTGATTAASTAMTILRSKAFLLSAGLLGIIGVGVMLFQNMDKVKEIMAKVGEAITGALEKLSDPAFIQGMIDSMLSVINSITAMIPQVVAGITKAIPAIVNGITSFITSAIPTLLTAAVQFFTAVIQALPTIITAITTALPRIITLLLGSIGALISALLSALMQALPQLIAAGIQLFMALIEALPTVIMAIVDALPKIITAIIAALVMALPLLIEAGIKLFMALIGALPQIITVIVGALPKIITAIIGALMSALPQLIRAGITLFVAIISNLPTIIFEILKAIPQIITAIVGGLKDSWPDISAAGLDLIKGLWKGINDAAGWILDKIKGFGKKILGGIKDFFGIKSPSKVFAQLGDFMGQGLGTGLENSLSVVQKSVPKLMKGIAEASEIGINTPITGIVSDTRAAAKITTPAVSSNQKRAEATNKTDALLEKLINITQGQNPQIVLDTGVLVGSINKKVDLALVKNALMAKRGVTV